MKIAHETEEQSLQVAYIRGGPKDSDMNSYEIRVGLSDQPDRTISIDTNGLVKERFELKLVHFPKSTTALRLRVFVRGDSGEQGSCRVELGDSCVPRRTGLGITLTALRDGKTVAQRTIFVPFVGPPAP